MKIELLNVMIQIEKNSVIRDRYGNHKNAWVPFYACHATVSAEAPTESSEAGLIIDGSKVDFTVRYCSAATMVTSTEYRIVFNDQVYNILGVDHMNYRRQSVKYRCQMADR